MQLLLLRFYKFCIFNLNLFSFILTAKTAPVHHRRLLAVFRIRDILVPTDLFLSFFKKFSNK
jgi:hypothetical protein